MNRRTRRALGAAAALGVLTVGLRLAYGPGDIGFDPAFSLVWGDELRHLVAPDYGAAVTPTPHPLANAIGALASLAGDAGSDVLIALSYVSFAALGLVAYVVGERSFGVTAGVAFSAMLLTRPLLVGETLQASTDIPFLALVLAAVALELARDRRGGPVLATLALAGLLRPEAWLLSVAYAVYLLAPAQCRADRSRAVRLAALALSAPLLWMLTDIVTTGEALHSVTRTQDLAEHLQRERGISAALSDLPVSLRTTIGGGVAWSGIAAGALALFASQQRARVPLVLLALGLATFVALGAANLPVLNRYLLVPCAVVMLFCAGGLAAFGWLRPPGRLRFAGAALSAIVAVTLAVGAPVTRGDVRATIDKSRERSSIYAALDELVDTARTRGLTKLCRPLQTAVYRPVPVLAYRLGVKPSRIEVVRPIRARRGLMFAARLEAVIGDVGLYPGVVIPSDQLKLPESFRRVEANGSWTLAVRGC